MREELRVERWAAAEAGRAASAEAKQAAARDAARAAESQRAAAAALKEVARVADGEAARHAAVANGEARGLAAVCAADAALWAAGVDVIARAPRSGGLASEGTTGTGAAPPAGAGAHAAVRRARCESDATGADDARRAAHALARAARGGGAELAHALGALHEEALRGEVMMTAELGRATREHHLARTRLDEACRADAARADASWEAECARVAAEAGTGDMMMAGARQLTLSLLEASDTCCLYMPARWVASCL